MRKQQVWPRVADTRQIASVRRIVLDDGPERGVRALAFSTGGGLDFWALSDRAMDIGPLNWRGMPVAWQSATGFRSAALTDLEADGGMGFMRAFSGMLTTCGLDHVGAPAAGHPLHGRFPYTPARLLAYGEDWDCERPILFCEGEVDQARHLGEVLRLRRRIEADIGGTALRFRDRVANLGATEQIHHMLYHINVGWPALADGSAVRLDGDALGEPFAAVSAGERSTAVYPSGAGPTAACSLSLPGLGGRMVVRFDVGTLPQVQVWRDPRPRHHVLAIEPRTAAAGVMLAPGESRDYRVSLEFSAD